MYQYEFFTLRGFKLHIPRIQKRPDCFVTLDDIEWIRSSYWSEHCLECGEPLCYETCPMFEPRGDMRCRRFGYGMFHSPFFPSFPYSVEVRFRKWAKMESTLYPGSFTPQKALAIDKEWRRRSAKKRWLMAQGKRGLKKYPVTERRKFDGSKYTFSSKEDCENVQDTRDFVLQLYSFENEPFTLFFDVTDDEPLVFREGVTVFPGYNQHRFDLSAIFPQKGRLRAKFYPADNREADIVFLLCELTKLREGVTAVNYPESGVQQKAEKKAPAAKVKCVAWDLDNTLWDGVLIESDPEKLTLRDGALELMKALDERGVIQIAASKNTESETTAVLDRLGVSEYFVYTFINWNAKSLSLKQAAEALNIGIDSFALIDDSAFERSEVTYELPMVRTYAEDVVLPENSGAFLALPEFDVPVTEESRARRSMYMTEKKRRAAMDTQAGDGLGFLRSCEIRAGLSRLSDESMTRSCELLQRTNQLNLSGSRYQPDSFKAHAEQCAADGTADCWVLTCADRFGSYGQTAYFEAHIDGDTLKITEFAMSCRIAHKCVEAALMRSLFDIYAAKGAACISLCGRRTERNSLLIDSFTAAGFTDESSGDAILLTCRGAENLVNSDVVTVAVETE